MPQKRHKPEKILAKLRQVDVWVSQDRTRPTPFARLECQVTYYRWRQEYGGLKTDQVKWLKDLETENVRLRKAIPHRERGTMPATCVHGAGSPMAPRTISCCRRASDRGTPAEPPGEISEAVGQIHQPARHPDPVPV